MSSRPDDLGHYVAFLICKFILLENYWLKAPDVEKSREVIRKLDGFVSKTAVSYNPLSQFFMFLDSLSRIVC